MINDFSQLWYLVAGFLFLDIILGILNAFKLKCLASEESFNGLIKKTAIIVVIAFAYLLELSSQAPVFKLTCIFYIIYESFSIIELAGAIGIPIPSKIKQAVSLLQQTIDETPEIKIN